VTLGALFEVLHVITNITTAVVLFPILKRQSESLALGYVAARIVEGRPLLSASSPLCRS
jgi:Domain of unknown function (DUF4386)